MSNWKITKENYWMRIVILNAIPIVLSIAICFLEHLYISNKIAKGKNNDLNPNFIELVLILIKMIYPFITSIYLFIINKYFSSKIKHFKYYVINIVIALISVVLCCQSYFINWGEGVAQGHDKAFMYAFFEISALLYIILNVFAFIIRKVVISTSRDK